MKLPLNHRNSFGPGVSKIVGAVLLWDLYDPLMIDFLPDDICHSVVAKLILLELTLPDAVNPIDKISIVATKIGGTVSLDVSFQTMLLMKKVETPTLRILLAKLMFNFETQCMQKLCQSL
mmetsp:Transcript_13648/g.31509  ORF Transcript_13648/g.31509 Transcript_13648/m.31509 type:complete len:120 (+) Transcript_13648:209-568(+)